MKKTKIEIIPAEPDSAEQQLAFTSDEAALLVETSDMAEFADIAEFTEFAEIADTTSILDALGRDSQQSPESQQQDEIMSSGGTSRVAVIPVVDRVVDAPVVREKIDLRIGGNHYQLPG